MIRTKFKLLIIFLILLVTQLGVLLISCSDTKSQDSSTNKTSATPETISQQTKKSDDKESSTTKVPVTNGYSSVHKVKVLDLPRSTKAPSTSFIKENRQMMETRGFGGTVIFIDYSKGGVRYRLEKGVFDHRYAIKLSDLQPEIDNLVKAGFAKFKDNFLGIHCSSPAGLINWFGGEDYWNIILNNIGVAAIAAKKAGLRGVMLDCENYLKKKNFHYPALNARYPGHGDREAWKTQVRLRGKQIMQKMIQGYGSDFRLLFRMALQYVRQVEELSRKHPLRVVGANEYELVPAFVNGLIEGLSGSADIVEFAPEEANFKKGFPSAVVFDRMWDILKPIDGYAVSNPDYIYPQNVPTYNVKYKIGFTLWFDGNENPKKSRYKGTSWDNVNLRNNTWTPSTLRDWFKRCKNSKYTTALYCTIYKGNYINDFPDWWKKDGINQQYLDVLNEEFK